MSERLQEKSSKIKMELKHAIQNLKINRPFELRPLAELVGKIPHFEVTQSEVHQNEGTQTKLPQIEGPQNDVAQRDLARPESKNSQGMKPHQNEVPEIKVPHFKEPQIEHPQNEVGQNEHSQIEVPQNEKPRTDGFFMISHSLFRDPLLRNLPGDAFRVYLWMCANGWRYPSSTGHIRAAVGYIAKGTGVSTATASRCLQILKGQKLIRLAEVDFKRGNTWFVFDRVHPSRAKSARELHQNEGPQIEVPRIEQHQTEVPQFDKGGLSKRDRSNINLIGEPHQIDVEEKNYINTKKENKNSLSEGGTVESKVEHYLDGIKSIRKKESEREAFEELKSSYDLSEIERAFEYVLANGTLPAGEPCHSPVAFLSVAIGDVLARIRSFDEKAEWKKIQIEEENRKECLKASREEVEAKEYREQEKEFLRVFPTRELQEAEIAIVAKKFPILNPTGAAMRSLAINDWWSRQMKNKTNGQ